MKRPLFIAIGVHQAHGLAVLDGVLKGVADLTAWARDRQYDVISISDETEPVTVERIRNLLTPLENGAPSFDLLLDRPRIIVYFCGHGLHAPGDQYWILSAGPDNSRQRVSSLGFRETLAKYGPRQIAIFSDACRTPQVVTGYGDSVIDPYEADVRNPQKDLFFSSRDGDASFAMPAKAGQPAYCVFSEALRRALTQPDGENLDKLYLKLGRKIVSSDSLADYLESRVPEIAMDVGKHQIPDCQSGFRPEINDYIEFPTPRTPPQPIALPASSVSGFSGPQLFLPFALSGIAGVIFRFFSEKRLDQAGNEQDLPPEQQTTSPNTPPKVDISEFKAFSQELKQKHQDTRRMQSRSEWRAPFIQEVQHFVETSIGNFDELNWPTLIVSDEWPQLIGSTIQESSDAWHRPLPFRDRSTGHWFRQPDGFSANRRSNVLIATAGDVYVPTTCFDGLWCAMVFAARKNEFLDNVDAGGVELLAWGARYDDRFSAAERIARGELHATEALKGFSAGTLSAADIPLFAQNMRIAKHADPMLGIISAYLYNNIGDIDNIRRICYFYHINDQDVPFDIAMLAGVPLEHDKARNCFVITVPAVKEIPAAHRINNEPEFTWCATPQITIDVAGVSPLLRAGWQHIRNSKHRIHQQCWELVDHLTAAPISSFAGVDVGNALIQAFKEFKS